MYRNYAVTIAKTGSGCERFRADYVYRVNGIATKAEIGCLDATDLIAAGSVVKPTTIICNPFPVVSEIRRGAA